MGRTPARARPPRSALDTSLPYDDGARPLVALRLRSHVAGRAAARTCLRSMSLSLEPDSTLGAPIPVSGPEPTAAPPAPAPHRALYRRWRAQTFGEIVGQEAVVETLRNSVRLGRVGHAYLFSGPRGTGKTSMARILAKAVNCTDLVDAEPCDRCLACVAIREGAALDVVEIDAASNRGIDQVRALRDLTRLAPSDLRRRVFIVDEAHQITRDGWPALLKTLEEPSGDVLFVFASTNPADIPPTILSRVQRFSFRPLTPVQIGGKLERILADEGRAADPGALVLVAGLAAGGMRDAESMLEQLLSATGGTLTEDEVRAQLGMAPASLVEVFVAAMLSGDALAGVRSLDQLEAEGRDLRFFTDQIVERLRQAMVARMTGDMAGDELAAESTLPELAFAARRIAGLDAERTLVGGQRFQLELALLSGVREGAGPGAKAGPQPRAGVPAVAAAETRPAAETRAATSAAPRGSPPVAPASGASRIRGSAGETAPRPAPVAAAAPPAAAAAAPPALPAPARITPPPETAAQPGSGATQGSPDAATPAGSDDALARLVERWPEVVSTVSRNPAVRPLVAACRPLRLDGDVVVLGFPEDKRFLREKAEQRLAALEAGIAAVLGEGYRVRCVAANIETLAAPAAQAIGRDNLEQAKRVFGDDLVDIGEVE
jgi:DNA polymerase-3 subunit gamma/tau